MMSKPGVLFSSNAKKDARRKSRGAYIAFMTFLILAAVILLVGTTLALLSVFEIQQSPAESGGAERSGGPLSSRGLRCRRASFFFLR